MNKEARELVKMARELVANKIIAIFPGENPKSPYMFWYLDESGTVWYTSGGRSKANEGTYEEFVNKVKAGRSRAQFVENGQIVSHPPKVAAEFGTQYESLNDAEGVTGNAGYAIGKTEIWYHKDDFDGRESKPDPKNLGKTHVLVGRIAESNLPRAYHMMQGHMWSPKGEARTLIRGKRISHTTMSSGDVFCVGNKTYFLARFAGLEEL